MKKVLGRVNVEIVKRLDQAKGLPRPARALDRQAHLRLARSLTKAGQGLGMPQSQVASISSLVHVISRRIGIDKGDPAGIASLLRRKVRLERAGGRGVENGHAGSGRHEHKYPTRPGRGATQDIWETGAAR